MVRVDGNNITRKERPRQQEGHQIPNQKGIPGSYGNEIGRGKTRSRHKQRFF